MAKTRTTIAPGAMLALGLVAMAALAIIAIVSVTGDSRADISTQENLAGDAWWSRITPWGQRGAADGGIVLRGRTANGTNITRGTGWTGGTGSGGGGSGGSGGGTGGGTYSDRCDADQGEFCKQHPSDRMVEVPGSGPCPTQMSCYTCAAGYVADTHIDECLLPGEPHFSSCADHANEGWFCETPARATNPDNRVGGTGAILMQTTGDVIGPVGSEWAGQDWSVKYFCPGNSQDNDPWQGGYYCYSCVSGYAYDASTRTCIADGSVPTQHSAVYEGTWQWTTRRSDPPADGVPACDTATHCADHWGGCYAVNTLMRSSDGESWGCANTGYGPAAYPCYGWSDATKGRTLTSQGVTFCCSDAGQWTGDLTDCS